MKKIIITAGGTSEKIDNVRKITNSSSGKLALTIAKTLLKEYKDIWIDYICSKSALRPNEERARIIEVEGVLEVKRAVEELLTNSKIDYFIHTMAVSDYRTDYVTTLEKLRESLQKEEEIETLKGNKISSQEKNVVVVLKPTPKIISLVKDISPSTYLVGFKLLDGVQKEYLIEVAKNLRDKNKCDLVIANDLETIRKGQHLAYLIDKKDNIEKANGKEEIAKKLVKKIAKNERI